MMDITSNELLRRKAVSETLMNGTSSDGATTFYSAENVHYPGLSCPVSVGEKRKRNADGESCNTGNYGVGSNDNRDAERGKESVHPKISDCAGLKFNNFEKLRKEVNFSVGQTWALYDKVDGMPRQYAVIRRVLSPSFELRITNLEPDPDDEKEIQWSEEDLPVSAGQFRLGKKQNTKDLSIFSHVIHCKEGSNAGHLIVSPRKGETWALFKNWDINWSSEPDSHRKYEYDIVEILSNNADGAGVSVAILHKAKGFASVFFRMGTGNADVSRILPHNIYQFSHRIPSFKVTGIEGKGLPKDAYELDQAALPQTVEEKTVPSHLIPKPKPEAVRIPREGKVFQTGQFWAYSGHYDNMPHSYCRIQKITLTQAFEQEAELKLHACRLNAFPFPENVIIWEDKYMPVGCGTFWAVKSCSIFTPGQLSHQIVPQTSMDGNEYTILPKVGEVWAIYRQWFPHFDVNELERNNLDFDIIEVLDDAFTYKVLALERALFPNEEENNFFGAAKSRSSDCYDEDGSGVIFKIPQSKILRFSHQVPASRVIKEVDGELKALFRVDPSALPACFDL